MDVREMDRPKSLTQSEWEEELEEHDRLLRLDLEELEEHDRVIRLGLEDSIRTLRSPRAAEGPRRQAPIIPRFMRRPLPQKLWQAVTERRRRERIGLDLISFTCREFISKSEILEILGHFYPPGGYWGSPLTRCYLECPHCTDDIVLGRNVGDADNFHVIGGAIQQFPAAAAAAADKLVSQIPTLQRRPGSLFRRIETIENHQEGNASSSAPDLKNEAYSDALLDSPNDIQQAAKSSSGFVVY